MAARLEGAVFAVVMTFSRRTMGRVMVRCSDCDAVVSENVPSFSPWTHFSKDSVAIADAGLFKLRLGGGSC